MMSIQWQLSNPTSCKAKGPHYYNFETGHGSIQPRWVYRRHRKGASWSHNLKILGNHSSKDDATMIKANHMDWLMKRPNQSNHQMEGTPVHAWRNAGIQQYLLGYLLSRGFLVNCTNGYDSCFNCWLGNEKHQPCFCFTTSRCLNKGHLHVPPEKDQYIQQVASTRKWCSALLKICVA